MLRAPGLHGSGVTLIRAGGIKCWLPRGADLMAVAGIIRWHPTRSPGLGGVFRGRRHLPRLDATPQGFSLAGLPTGRSRREVIPGLLDGASLPEPESPGAPCPLQKARLGGVNKALETHSSPEPWYVNKARVVILPYHTPCCTPKQFTGSPMGGRFLGRIGADEARG